MDLAPTTDVGDATRLRELLDRIDELAALPLRDVDPAESLSLCLEVEALLEARAAARSARRVGMRA